LELLREEDTAASIASRYGITMQTLNQWKKKFLENASLAFDVGGATKEYREKIDPHSWNLFTISRRTSNGSTASLKITRYGKSLLPTWSLSFNKIWKSWIDYTHLL
jgi:transposase-like protein